MRVTAGGVWWGRGMMVRRQASGGGASTRGWRARPAGTGAARARGQHSVRGEEGADAAGGAYPQDGGKREQGTKRVAGGGAATGV